MELIIIVNFIEYFLNGRYCSSVLPVPTYLILMTSLVGGYSRCYYPQFTRLQREINHHAQKLLKQLRHSENVNACNYAPEAGTTTKYSFPVLEAVHIFPGEKFCMCRKTQVIFLSTCSGRGMGRPKCPFFSFPFFHIVADIAGQLNSQYYWPVAMTSGRGARCSPQPHHSRLFTVHCFVLLLELRLESWAPSPGGSTRDPQKSWLRAGEGVSRGGGTFWPHPHAFTTAASLSWGISLCGLECFIRTGRKPAVAQARAKLLVPGHQQQRDGVF